jgi:hypothetical protein
MKSDRRDEFDPRGKTSENWCCVDCGAAIANLAGKDTPVYRPEAYMVRNTVWKAAAMEPRLPLHRVPREASRPAPAAEGLYAPSIPYDEGDRSTDRAAEPGLRVPRCRVPE